MNKRQHDEFYPQLVKLQHGEFCAMCERDKYDLLCEGQKPEFLIDCIPNDGDHTDIKKLQILCRSCNTKKNWPSTIEPFERTATPEMIRGSRYEKDFRRWVAGQFLANPNSGFTYTYLKNSGAEKVNCSPETIKRYLDKMASAEGLYEWEERFSSEPVLVLKNRFV